MSVDVSVDHTLAAGIYSAANEFSWGQHLVMPGLQAAANILLLEKQRELSEEAQTRQTTLLDIALGRYDNMLGVASGYISQAYPSIPQAAEYVPVDPCAVQSKVIEDNTKAITKADDWAQCVSRLHNQNDVARSVVLDSRWLVNMDMYSMTIGDLLRGKAHVSDLMEVMTDSAEMALATGRVGGSRRLTSHNLAKSRLQRQSEGRKELQREAELISRLAPASRQANIMDMMQKPEHAIALALTQAQLIQNSLQNLYNRNAQKPPWRMAQLAVRMERAVNNLQYRASAANMVNKQVPNYAAILQPMIHELTRQFQNPAAPAAPVTPPVS